MLMCIMQSCSEEQLVVEPTTEQLSRSESDVRVSVTNPNLIDDWENVETIYLNSSSRYAPTGVTAPWKDGNISALPSDFLKGIKKKDGWEMLFHTFKDFGIDKYQNYMCFYNKFTGIIKVFYYYEAKGESATLTFWNMNGSTPLKIFDLPKFFALADNQINTNKRLTFSNVSVNNSQGITGLEEGWNGFTYQVSRYSSENTDCLITLSPYNQKITEFHMEGDGNGKLEGVIKSVTSTDNSIINDGSTKHKGIVTKTGEDALKFMNTLKKANENHWAKIFGSAAEQMLSSIAGNNIFKGLNEGLKYLFGRSTASNHYTKSDVYLELMQKIEIKGNGTMNLASNAASVNFNLKDILSGTNNFNHTLIVNNGGASIKHLGTWTLKRNPVIYYYRTVPIYRDYYQYHQNPQDGVDVYGTLEAPNFWHESTNTEIEINPDIKKYVKNYHVDIQYAGCSIADGEQFRPNVDDVYRIYNPEALYHDNNTSTYIIPKNVTGWHFLSPLTPEQLKYDVNQIYYDFGEILEGRMIAFITVNMDIDYNGHKFNVNETRAYPVEYGYINTYKPEEFHNPPYSYVINYKWAPRNDLFRLYGGDPTRVPNRILNN